MTPVPRSHSYLRPQVLKSGVSVLHTEFRDQGKITITTSPAWHIMVSPATAFAFWEMHF